MRKRSHDYIRISLLSLLLVGTSLPPICRTEEVAADQTTTRGESERARRDDDAAKKREDQEYEEETGERVRARREVGDDDLGGYTGQDEERSSLYDEYEAKDIAKRGVPGGPEDYEEFEDAPTGMLGDMLAVHEPANEMRKRAAPSDARIKGYATTTASEKGRSIRDRNAAESKREVTAEREGGRSKERSAVREESTDGNGEKSTDGTVDGTDLAEPSYSYDIAKTALVRTIDRVGSNPDSRGFARTEERKIADGAPAAGVQSSRGGMRRKGSDTREIIAKIDDGSAKEERGDAALYEKRAEERIQRKIDSIKEEIRRDVEARRRIRDIEANNARFDELRENEARSVGETRNMAKRSVRDAASASSRNVDKRRRAQQRTLSGDTSNAEMRTEDSLKKKREHVRRTILASNDECREKRRRSRSYAFDGGEPRNELSADLGSYPRADNGMSLGEAPLSVIDQGGNDGTFSDNQMSVSENSSQELSPRLAKEYKEAFGGLQSEPGSALARFKRIKRVLGART